MAKRKRLDPLVQLAASVLAQETTEMPWGFLRHTYFTAKGDGAAARHLSEWADKYGIRVSVDGRNARRDPSVLFSLPMDPKSKVPG